MLLPIKPVFFKGFLFVLNLSFSFAFVFSQEQNSRILSLDEALSLALQNNPDAKNAELNVQASKTSANSSVTLPATNFQYYYGNIHSSANDYFFEVKQSFLLPSVYNRQNEIAKNRLKISENEQQLTVANISAQVKIQWNEWLLAYRTMVLASEQDSLFEELFNLNEEGYKLSKVSLLEKTLVEDRYAQAQNELFQAQENIQIVENKLKQLLFIDGPILPDNYDIDLYAIDSDPNRKDKFSPARQLSYCDEVIKLKINEVKLAQSNYSPEFTAGYFSQQINGAKGFSGIMAGISVPLWFVPQKAKIKEARIQSDIARNNKDKQQFLLKKEIENHQITLDKLFVDISYFRENALKVADMLEKDVREKMKNTETDTKSYIETISRVYSIRKDYLEKLVNYNSQAIELEYLIL